MRNKVKQFVDSRNLTAYRFIKETGIAPGTGYKLYKNPKHMPSPSVLEVICDTYEVQPNEILEWTKDDCESVGELELTALSSTNAPSDQQNTNFPSQPKQQIKGHLLFVA